MHQLMVKENVIPGVRQKQVLRANHLSTENKLPGNLAGRPRELWDEDQFEDGMWKSKPRKRPLIGIIDSILDMPGFQTSPRPTLPSKNFIMCFKYVSLGFRANANPNVSLISFYFFPNI